MIYLGKTVVGLEGSLNPEGKRIRERLRKRQIKTCPICNTTFTTRKKTKIYCSLECRKKANKDRNKRGMAEKRIIDNLSKMLDEQVKKLQELASRQQFVEDVLIINNKKCYVCNSTDNLIRHHVSYTPEETVILCKKCHTLLHRIILHGRKCRPEDF